MGFADGEEVMAPADVYVGFLDSNFTPHVMDSRTEAPFEREAPDAQQDAVVLSGGYADGVLSFTFARLLDTTVCGLWLRCSLLISRIPASHGSLVKAGPLFPVAIASPIASLPC